MRKKLLIVILTAVAIFASAFCLSACVGLDLSGNGQTDVVYPPDDGGDDGEDIVDGDGSGENTGGNEDGQDDGDDGDSEDDEPEHEHTLVYFSAAEASCASAGNIEYWHCESCGLYFADESAEVEIGEEDIAIPATGHEYIEHLVSPTCTDYGYTEYICKACGYSYVDENSYKEPAGHSFGEWQIVTQASCENGGEMVRYCSSCGFAERIFTDKTEHDFREVIVAPACTQRGYTYYVCKECGYTYTDENSYVAAAGHSFGEWVVTVQPTCVSEGVRERCCLECGARENEVLSELPHTYAATIINPTCTEGGFTCYECEVCGHSYIADETDALGHDYKYTVVEPTCTEIGYTEYCCERCGDSGISEGSETPVKPHNLKEVVIVPATCVAAGEKLIYCTDCDYSIKEGISALGHDYALTIFAPTCTEQGYTEHVCKVCGHSYKDCYPQKTEHIYKVTVISPTCTKGGCTLHECSVCGYSYTDEITEASGHKYTVTVVPPTCTSKGYTDYKCDVCGYTFRNNYIDETDHEYVANIVAPTCTDRGYTEYICSDCGRSYIDENSYTETVPHEFVSEVISESTCAVNGVIRHTCTCCGLITEELLPLKQHSYGEWVEELSPTCTQSGTAVQSCIYCGRQNSAVMPALGHDYVEIIVEPDCVNEGYTLHECSRCKLSHKDGFVEALGHDYGDWYTVKPATCTEEGSEARVCSVCGAEELRTVGVTEHNYICHKVEPSCTESGYTEYVCADCGDSYLHEYIAPLGHDMLKIGSGYLENGAEYTDFRCSRCGFTERVESELPAATEGLIYTLSSDGDSYTVSGLEADSAATEIIIPAQHNGLPVLEIAAQAFNGNALITRAVLPYGLKIIGKSAFMDCTALRSVNIPETVTNIGTMAFRNCTCLEDLQYDAVCVVSAVTDIFSYAGAEAELVLTVGSAVQSLPPCLFFSVSGNNSSMLKEIVFEENSSLKSVGEMAFSGCKYIKRIELPSTVEVLGDCAFEGCSNLEYASVPSNASGLDGAFIGVSSDFELDLKVVAVSAYKDILYCAD